MGTASIDERAGAGKKTFGAEKSAVGRQGWPMAAQRGNLFVGEGLLNTRTSSVTEDKTMSPVLMIVMLICAWMAVALAMLWGMLRLSRRHHPTPQNKPQETPAERRRHTHGRPLHGH